MAASSDQHQVNFKIHVLQGDKEEKIFLVDFSVHDDPTFYRPDYISGMIVRMKFGGIEWPKSEGGDRSTSGLNEHELM